jgi:septal ring factor EnvC (AmiA/AmiB activator)
MFRISSSLSSIPCSFCAVRKVSCAILFSVVGEKKRIVKATADALTTANQQLQETEKTIETANKALTQAQQSIQQQTTLMFRISSSLSSIPCSFCAVRKVSCAILFSVVAVASWVFNQKQTISSTMKKTPSNKTPP